MLRYLAQTTERPKTEFARRLRKTQTSGEIILWQKVRNKKFHGLKFRRQVPVGPYIVDFLCVSKKLIIEIDGDSHYEEGALERDRKRENYLKAHGFKILRFGERRTVESVDAVLEEIGSVLGY